MMQRFQYILPLIWLALFASVPSPSFSMQNINSTPSIGQEDSGAIVEAPSEKRNARCLSCFPSLSWKKIRSTVSLFVKDFFYRHEDVLIHLVESGTALEVESMLKKLKGRNVAVLINGITVYFFVRAENFLLSRGSLLHAAVLKPEFDVAEVLLRHGADIHSRDGFERTPLHIAIRFQGHVHCLLEQGADPNLADHSNRTALHYAVMYDSSVESILAKSQKIDAVDSFGMTPLFYATNSATAHLLIEHGADVHFRIPSNGMTPMHIACQYNIKSQTELRRAQAVVTVLKLALNASGVDILDNRGLTPLSYSYQSFMEGFVSDDESEEEDVYSTWNNLQSSVDDISSSSGSFMEGYTSDYESEAENVDATSVFLQANVDDISYPQESFRDAVSVILRANVSDIRRGSVPEAYLWWKGFQCSSLQSQSTDVENFIEQLPDLNCPILLEFPETPVLASDGYTYDWKRLSMYLSDRVKENLFVVSPVTRSNLEIQVLPNVLSPFIEEFQNMLNNPETEWKDWVIRWREDMPFLCPDAQHYQEKTIPVEFGTSISCYANRALHSLAIHAFEKLSAKSRELIANNAKN